MSTRLTSEAQRVVSIVPAGPMSLAGRAASVSGGASVSSSFPVGRAAEPAAATDSSSSSEGSGSAGGGVWS